MNNLLVQPCLDSNISESGKYWEKSAKNFTIIRHKVAAVFSYANQLFKKIGANLQFPKIASSLVEMVANNAAKQISAKGNRSGWMRLTHKEVAEYLSCSLPTATKAILSCVKACFLQRFQDKKGNLWYKVNYPLYKTFIESPENYLRLVGDRLLNASYVSNIGVQPAPKTIPDQQFLTIPSPPLINTRYKNLCVTYKFLYPIQSETIDTPSFQPSLYNLYNIKRYIENSVSINSKVLTKKLEEKETRSILSIEDQATKEVVRPISTEYHELSDLQHNAESLKLNNKPALSCKDHHVDTGGGDVKNCKELSLNLEKAQLSQVEHKERKKEETDKPSQANQANQINQTTEVYAVEDKGIDKKDDRESSEASDKAQQAKNRWATVGKVGRTYSLTPRINPEKEFISQLIKLFEDTYRDYYDQMEAINDWGQPMTKPKKLGSNTIRELLQYSRREVAIALAYTMRLVETTKKPIRAVEGLIVETIRNWEEWKNNLDSWEMFYILHLSMFLHPLGIDCRQVLNTQEYKEALAVTGWI